MNSSNLTSKNSPRPGLIGITVSPTTLTMDSKAQHTFTASVTNTSDSQVLWSATGGSVTTSGLFVAPQVGTATEVTLTATSAADPSRRATAVVKITSASASPLAVEITNLPAATQGAAYAAALSASGGTAPYTWSLTGGALPGSLRLTSDGTMGGTAGPKGRFGFTATVKDAAAHTASGSFSVAVSGVNDTAKFDGPAELPSVYMNTSVADTPAPGKTRMVTTAANLQSALDSANCGDTIKLKAGVTFSGVFEFPAKACDNNHWIVVRSDASDRMLPPEGLRLTPCYAGISSLPGRPAFACTATQNVAARLVFSGTGSGPIVWANGANHYRLIGLEVTRESSRASVSNLASNEDHGTSDHIVFDRVWMHGTAQDETTRGIMLSGSTYVAVVDSFFTDFHCVALTGSCTDAQAIAGGLGDLPMGPYKIVNNFLEASGENILFGGGEATQTPSDIEIRRNHFFKPLLWMKGHPGFVGGRDGHPFIVKNHFEIKNGARVLFEGNLLENNWGGFSQSGFSMVLVPKNQNGHCALCVVHDITARYSTIAHVGGGIVVGNGVSDSGALALGAWNESFHDLVITDVDDVAYTGGGYLFQEGSGSPASALHDIAVSHVTGLSRHSQGAAIVVGNKASSPRMYNFTWTDNVFTANGSGIISKGGDTSDCAYGSGGPVGILNRCFHPYTFSHNVLIGAALPWPSANFATSSLARVFGANLQSSLYSIDPASPYKNAGADGKDPGADIAAVQAAIAGVE